MSMTPDIERIIVKFVNRTTSIEEEMVLNDWLNNPINEQVFTDYVQVHYAITLQNLNKERLRESQEKLLFDGVEEEIMSSVANGSRVAKVFNIRKYLKYAAALIIVGAMTTFFVSRKSAPSESIKITSTTVKNVIHPGGSKAILTLENGIEVELKEDSQYLANGVKSSGSKIVYNRDRQNEEVEVQYNYLTIPRGGYFFVQLSDGTKVWLNSESQLKYPKNFASGSTREVELIYGEAYFDVSPSGEHNGSAFLVNNATQNVEVLGTEFNVKAYKDENHVLTTLVEGLVVVNADEKRHSLKPNQQAKVNTETKDVEIEYVDVNSEISWKDGVFSFKGKTLKEIMLTISRWYDVDVIFEDKNLETIKFKGVINKDKDIEEILLLMKSSTINNYEIDGNTIILK